MKLKWKIYNMVWVQIADINKMTKWQYPSTQATNLKNKATLFSPTFKVEENKVPSDFYLEAILLRISHFDLFLDYPLVTITVSLQFFAVLSF